MDAKDETTSGHAAEETRDPAPEDSAPAVRAAPEQGEAEKRDAALPPSGLARVLSDGRLPLVLATLVPILLFMVLPPLSRSGLWDPHELNVADLARRVALNLHHADTLALDGADNSLPHLNDLGRPQLPFTSIALGFAAFGLHEWSGRLPLAVWGLIGVLATFGWVARLVDRRAGLFSAVALTTMPLYFVHARTMLGDIVTMSALSMSFGGLAVVVFDRREDGARPLRFGWLLVALVGLACGWFSRGGLLGVAVPLLGVGAAWLVAMAGGSRKGFFAADAVAAAALAVGVVVAYKGLTALHADRAGDLDAWVGAMLRPQSRYPTFDYFIGHLGPALAPWSAFVPFAMGRLYVAPVGVRGFAYQRESEARMAIVVGAAVCFLAHGLMASKTDLIAFSGPAILAAACGLALRDYERGAHPSIAVGVGTAVFLGVFHHDFHQFPEKAYQAFSVVGASFPESFKERSLLLWTIALVGFAGIAFLTWVERDADRSPFDPDRYLGVIRSLRDAWDGLLSLAYFATVAGASLAGLAIWVGTRTHAKWLPTLSGQIRDGVLNAWWITAIVPLGAILATYFWCDVWLWAFRGGAHRRLRPGRGFEPFEEVVRQLRTTKGEAFWVTALVLLPLLYLQVPGAIFVALYKHGTKPLIACALALPSGIAIMLVLGILGDLLRGSRAAFLVLTGVFTGGVLCTSYYPALANQLSPKEVFESYQRVKRPGEPLGLYGVGGRTAAYYAGGQPPTFRDSQQAFDWLNGAGEGRRFIALASGELARLNFTWRGKHRGQNLPILDARSSQILLVASSLAEGERDQNPLGRIILAAPPTPQRRLDANLEDKLLVLGIDLVDSAT